MRREVPGTGLSIVAWTLLLLISVSLFVVWGGLLWRAPRQASHVMRFFVSYFAVIPLAALALWHARKLSAAHLLGAVATLWSLKLVVTATLYFAFARGADANYQPVLARTSESAADLAYQPAGDGFAFGSVEGLVQQDGVSIAAAVWIEHPRPGLPDKPARARLLSVKASAYDQPLALLHGSDSLTVHNSDGVLHTVHVTREGRVVQNLPLPPGSDVELHLSEPDVYRLRCDNHAGEVAWVVVVDHPYAQMTSDGRFAFASVPTGSLDVQAAIVVAGQLERTSVSARVASGHATTVALRLAPKHAFNQRGDR